MSNIGISTTRVTADAEFTLGTRFRTDGSGGEKEYVYGQANGAITAIGYACVELTGFDFALISVTQTTPGTAGYGSRVAAAQAVMADNEYGWFQVYGKGSLRTLASAAKGTRLNTTATNGALDDDAGSGSEAIVGIVLGTATGGAEATNTDAIFNYPSVGITL
jgi:hypothetical protein